MRWLLDIFVFVVLMSAAIGSGCANAQSPNETGVNANERPIAIVLENRIFLNDIHIDDSDKGDLRDYRAVAELILLPLITKYVKEHGLNATPQEMQDFRNWMIPLPENEVGDRQKKEHAAEDAQAIDEIARFSIERWKFNKALYQKYAGRVIFQQFGLEPLDAYQKWLLDEEKAGNFKIFDAKWKDAFWEYYKPKYHRHFVKEADPFKIPLWKVAC